MLILVQDRGVEAPHFHQFKAYMLSIFKRKKNTSDVPILTIWEGAESCWHYHLSTGGRMDVLCGNNHVMQTGLSLNTWGFRSEHIRESYCKECTRIAKEMELIKEIR